MADHNRNLSTWTNFWYANAEEIFSRVIASGTSHAMNNVIVAMEVVLAARMLFVSVGDPEGLDETWGCTCVHVPLRHCLW